MLWGDLIAFQAQQERKEEVWYSIDLRDGLGFNIQAPPPIGLEGFGRWKSKIEFFLQVNIED